MTSNDPEVVIHLPTKLELCTRQGYTFLRRHSIIFETFLFSVSLAARVDESRLIAARALAKGGNPEHQSILEDAEKNQSTVSDRLLRFGSYNSETLCIRLVDNLQCYFSDLIQECIAKQPSLLRSSETIRLDELLDFRSFRELTKYLVDRKLNSLSYGGIDGVIGYLERNLGITLTTTSVEHDLLKIAVELRNVYTHNRGRVDRVLMSRVGHIDHPRFRFEEGKRFHAGFDEIVCLANNLVELGRRLDGLAAPKFRMRRQRYETWYQLANPPSAQHPL